MIILVGTTKGGAGKTTTAINLAATLACDGHDVLVVDGDRQATAMKAIAIRQHAEHTPGIAVAHYVDGKTLRGQVLQQRDKYDHIVIDAGGRDSTALRAALWLCDVMLLPYQPKSFDVWALEDMSELLTEVRASRESEFPAYAFLSMAETKKDSKDNREAMEVIADYPELKLLDVKICDRKAFSNAASLGQCVDEFKPRDGKARQEMRQLVSALL